MTKNEAIALSKKYNMEFVRHYITRQAEGLYVESDTCIDELDSLARASAADNALQPCYIDAQYIDGGNSGAIYKLYIPTAWADLWGWA